MAVLNDFVFEKVSFGNEIDYTNEGSAEIDAGTLVAVGDSLVGVANSPIAVDDKGSLSLSGIYTAPKIYGAFTFGDPVGWDEDGERADGSSDAGALTNASTDWDYPVGTVVAAAEDTDERATIVLNL